MKKPRTPAVTHSKVTQKLQDAASSSPSQVSTKPVPEPSDDEIRNLLHNPQQFKKLFDQYFSDLHYEKKGPGQTPGQPENDLKMALKNPDTKGDARLVAAASLAAADPLLDAFGLAPSGEKWIMKDIVDDYPNWLGGKSKTQIVDEQDLENSD